ncbi:MAG: prepilin-type N-terminal cleavage/methylation domain-containing protein [Planctomycetota bacterium]
MTRRSGFTLIELVAATLLTAMLMAGLMSISWSILRETRRVRLSEASNQSFQLAACQLRRDFGNANRISVLPGSIQLITWDQATHRESLVEYRLAIVDDRRVLHRTSNVTGRQVLWSGVLTIQFESLADADPEASSPLVVSPLEVASGRRFGSTPERFVVSVQSLDGPRLWREVFDHHEG